MKQETKTLLQSKTVWGAILSVVGALAGLFGYSFGPEDQEAVIMIGTTLATAIGSLLAVYGRVKATKAIK